MYTRVPCFNGCLKRVLLLTLSDHFCLQYCVCWLDDWRNIRQFAKAALRSYWWPHLTQIDVEKGHKIVSFYARLHMIYARASSLLLQLDIIAMSLNHVTALLSTENVFHRRPWSINKFGHSTVTYGSFVSDHASNCPTMQITVYAN